MLLLQIPEVILIEILTLWCTGIQIGKLDCAVCNSKIRSSFLSVLQHPNFSLKNEFHSGVNPVLLLEWSQTRKAKIQTVKFCTWLLSNQFDTAHVRCVEFRHGEQSIDFCNTCPLLVEVTFYNSVEIGDILKMHRKIAGQITKLSANLVLEDFSLWSAVCSLFHSLDRFGFNIEWKGGYHLLIHYCCVVYAGQLDARPIKSVAAHDSFQSVFPYWTELLIPTTNLTEILLRATVPVSVGTQSLVCSHLPTLRVFDFIFFPEYVQMLQTLITQPKCLESLFIVCETHDVSVAHYYSLFTKLPSSFKELSILYCSNITEDIVKHILDQNPTVTMYVKHCEQLNSRAYDSDSDTDDEEDQDDDEVSTNSLLHEFVANDRLQFL